jgi:uncharacterized phiE125 gp8 family phage protein
MHRPVRVTPPATTPVTTAEAKTHLRVDSDDEDTLIGTLVQAATDHLDGYTGLLGRCIVNQTWRQDFDAFARTLRLPLFAAGVDSAVHVNKSGANATITSTNYELQADELGSFIRFIDGYSIPTDLAETRALRVTFTAGYGDAAAVPAALKSAILMLVGHWYDNREAVTSGAVAELPVSVMALTAPYRRVGV